MKKLLFAFFIIGGSIVCQAAITNIGPWTSLFKGVDYSFSRVLATTNTEKFAAINCLRVDLTDPDVVLFTTPRCTNGCVDPDDETAAENTSHFLEAYGLQVAVNCNFSKTGDTIGVPREVGGLAISQGMVVSTQQLVEGSIDLDYEPLVALLFTTNNLPAFIPSNWPPVSTEGVYTALAGNVALLTQGTNTAVEDDSDDPRTAFGYSEDNHYLFIMTVDGRNDGWSDGMTFFETADWMARFGAYNAVNVDGGGSTTMSMADCNGKAIRLNISSYVLGNGRERITGHNFGIYAPRLPPALKNLTALPGTTTALLAWNTDFEGTTQVEYGLTTNYGGLMWLDTTPTKTHVVTLTNLTPGTNYYFRATSSDGVASYSLDCSMSTTSAVSGTLLLNVDQGWKYTTNNLDTVDWKAPTYDDSTWLGPGPGLLYVGSSAAGAVKVTALPIGPLSSDVMRTYYFRTHFNFDGDTSAVSLVYSNFVDDGAVFYLNGTEIYRLRLPVAPTVITNLTFAMNRPCGSQGDAVCPDVFTLDPSFLGVLVQGDNVLAVEVHNYPTGTRDIVFGTALILGQPFTPLPQLLISQAGPLATIYWNGTGFTLQQSSDLSVGNNWFDVPGPVTSSPATVTNENTLFFRLRQ